MITLSANKTILQGTIRAGNKKIGEYVAGVDLHKQTMFVQELFIEREFRGNGIGGKTLTFLEDEATRLKLRRVILEPVPIDQEAFNTESLKRWYTRRGYTSYRSPFRLPTNLLAKALQ